MFAEDVVQGELAEEEVATRVKKYLPGGFLFVPDKAADKTYAEMKERDLRFVNPFTGQKLLIEVKWDRKSAETRHIAIEFQCSGIWSGIATTKAQVWVVKYFLDPCPHWIYLAVPTTRLIAEWRSKQWRTTYGGDQNRARMFLVPAHAFLTWGVRL